MEHHIKKNIRILADRFDHNIEYVGDCIELTNRINKITIVSPNKYGTVVLFNIADETQEIKVPDEEVCGLIIELLERKKLDDYWRNPGLLDRAKFSGEEGQEIEECIDEIKEKVKQENMDRFEYGGNMHNIEFFKGLIIIRGITSGFGTEVVCMEEN